MFKKSFLVLLVAVLAAGTANAAAIVYDFDGLSAAGYPGVNIGGQDGWGVQLEGSPGFVVRNDQTAWPGALDGNIPWGYGESLASRVGVDYKITGNNITLEFNGIVGSGAKNMFGLGVDDNFDGSVVDGDDEQGFLFGWTGKDGGYWTITPAAQAADISSAAVTPDTESVWRMVLDVDLAANGGDGSGSLSVQELYKANGTAVVDSLTAVTGLQNINLGILSMADANPTQWDGRVLEGYNGTFDYLTISGDVEVPEPGTWVLMLIGAVCLAAARLRRRNR